MGSADHDRRSPPSTTLPGGASTPPARPPLGARDAVDLLHIAQSLGSARTLQELGRRFRAVFPPLFRVPMYGIYLTDPWTGEPRLAASANVSVPFLARYEEHGREVDSLHAHLVATAQPAYNIGLMSMADWLEHPLYRRVKRLHDVRHEIQTPVITRDGIVGNINFGTSDPARGFTPAEVRLAAALGRIVGTAVERIHYTESLEHDRDVARAALELVGSAVVVSDGAGDPCLNAAARLLLDDVVGWELALHRLMGGEAGVTRFARHLPVVLASGESAVLHGQTTSLEDGGTQVTVLELQREGAVVSDRVLAALSPREREVALRVVDGLSDRQIADALFLSPHTVRQHVKAVYRKLDVDCRVQLTRLLLTPTKGPGGEGFRSAR